MEKNADVAVKIIKSIQKYRDAAQMELEILRKIREHDPQGAKGIIHLLSYFDYGDHVCMVFELLGKSVYDFMKDNAYNPFPLDQIKEFVVQLLRAVDFIHDLQMIHTDLKPENILLENSDVASRQLPKRLRSTSIKLIDFGSTIFQDGYHSAIVCTRHYRAPEIVLGLPWSYPCDMWSVGCILIELYTGQALFQTHENLEHLTMIERILGPIPAHMTNRTIEGKNNFQNGVIKPIPSVQSSRRVQGLKKLQDFRKLNDEDHKKFFVLLEELLIIDPEKRISSKEALKHPFLTN